MPISGIGSTTSNYFSSPSATKATTPSLADATTKKAKTAEEIAAENKQIKEDFLKIKKMNVYERIRANYLKSHGYTEESLASLPAEERKKIEDEIKEIIKKEMEKNVGHKGGSMDITV